jgi:hypothetical protein
MVTCDCRPTPSPTPVRASICVCVLTRDRVDAVASADAATDTATNGAHENYSSLACSDASTLVQPYPTPPGGAACPLYRECVSCTSPLGASKRASAASCVWCQRAYDDGVCVTVGTHCPALFGMAINSTGACPNAPTTTPHSMPVFVWCCCVTNVLIQRLRQHCLHRRHRERLQLSCVWRRRRH